MLLPRVRTAAAAALRQAHVAVTQSGRRAQSSAAVPSSAPGAPCAATTSDSLRLYNTLTRQKETFTPRPDQVRAGAVCECAEDTRCDPVPRSRATR